MADGFLRRRFNANPDLAPRIASALVLAAVAAVPLAAGGWAAALFVALAVGVMGWEYRRIACPGAGTAAAAAFALPVAAATFAGAAVPAPWLAAGLLGAAAIAAVRDRMAGRAAGWGALGILVLGAAGAAFVALRAREGDGLLIVLWLVAVVIATDVGAYAAGRSLGGPKLWPRVSPKKTWSGLAGGVLAAVLTGAAFSGATSGTQLTQVCTVSALAALVAQGGDLAESAVKRHFGVKDASALIPGHGGALDRLDGLLAATLAVAVTTWFFGKPVFLT